MMQIEPFFDSVTATITYVVSDPSTGHCAIIDSVHDFDLNSGALTSQSADKVIAYISKMNLHVEWILETHIHADHLSAASYLQSRLGGKIGIGEHIKSVLAYWAPIFNLGSDTPLDGSQFDVLFGDGMRFNIGNLTVNVIHTPGHTPDCISYLVEDVIFVGDTIFMPYVGTGRADFPGGSADDLYHSIQKILALPEQTRIFTCHDYPPDGQVPFWQSTVAEQRKLNIIVNDSVTENEFVKIRHQRDLNKPVPKLLLPALQVNLRAGKLAQPEDNQVQYIKIPVNQM